MLKQVCIKDKNKKGNCQEVMQLLNPSLKGTGRKLSKDHDRFFSPLPPIIQQGHVKSSCMVIDFGLML